MTPDAFKTKDAPAATSWASAEPRWSLPAGSSCGTAGPASATRPDPTPTIPGALGAVISLGATRSSAGTSGRVPRSRGILFKDRLVRAILDDRKTQTRRVVKPQLPDYFRPLAVEWYEPVRADADGYEEPGPLAYGAYDEDMGRLCPYGGPGDELWVREAWSQAFARTPTSSGIIWRADYGHKLGLVKDYKPAGGWKPGIHLRQLDARIRLRITEVRLERLQAITPEDAVAEGLRDLRDLNASNSPCWEGADGQPFEDPRHAFASLWDTINTEKPHRWTDDPWTWAITFQRLTPPETTHA